MPDLTRPFTIFNFSVYLARPDDANPFCQATFAECDGLEMSMEPKTIREGGNNRRPIHLIGPVSYGQLNLKRGMTPDSFELWNWFDEVLQKNNHHVRAHGLVIMLGSDRSQQAIFELTRCLPVKLKAPALNAAGEEVGIEEMQIAYETLKLRKPG